jgi:hypothetical protein
MTREIDGRKRKIKKEVEKREREMIIGWWREKLDKYQRQTESDSLSDTQWERQTRGQTTKREGGTKGYRLQRAAWGQRFTHPACENDVPLKVWRAATLVDELL